LEDWKIGPLVEQDYELALALGQDESIVRRVKAREMHPVMLAFGLWRDEPAFETLTAEIYANQRHQGSRAAADWTE
jgi:hypothetical protein